MNFEALADLMGGKIETEGEKDRTIFVVIGTPDRKVLFLQREWNGKTAYLANPSKKELARAKRKPFDMFSELPKRLM